MCFLLLVKFLFNCCCLNAETEDLKGCNKVVEGGECGGDTKVSVAGVDSVGEGCACICKCNAVFSCKVEYSLCTAAGNSKVNKVAALRLSPGCDAGKLISEGIDNCLEAGTDDVRMALHVVENTLGILEVLNVAHLVELIVADSLRCEDGLDLSDVVLACRNDCNAVAAR